MTGKIGFTCTINVIFSVSNIYHMYVPMDVSMTGKKKKCSTKNIPELLPGRREVLSGVH